MQHRIHRLSAAAAAVLFLGATAAGAVSSVAQELPPAQEVIARYVEAIGGAEAIRGHSSSVR